MRASRSVLLVATSVILCLVSLTSAGCGGWREAPSTEPEPFHINLPRLHVTYDEQGEPNIRGIGLSTVERLVRSDLTRLRFPPEQVRQLMEWNIQHIELALTADGLFVFVNNKPLPYLAWDEQTLANVGAMADRLDVLLPSAARFVRLQNVLPVILRGVGVGIVLELPLAPGQESIPFEGHPNGLPVTPPAEAAEKALTLHLPLQYDQAGEPSVNGIRVQELEKLTGQPVVIGKLDQATMGTIQQAEVESVLVKMEAKGLVLYVDGQPMPYIAWADEHLLNLIELIEVTSPDDPILGNPHLIDLVRRAVPGVKETDIQLSVEFPAQP